MKTRANLFVLLTLPLVALAPAGCTQPWNSTAGDAVKNAPPPPPEDFHTRVVMTPNIELVSGDGAAITTTPCEAIRYQVFNDGSTENSVPGVLFQQCSGCHGTGPTSGAVPNFDFILDPVALADSEGHMPQGSVCGGNPYVTPGDPMKSCVFVRMMNGTMPPHAIPGEHVDPLPYTRPSTVSNASVVYEWISHCMGVDGPATTPPGGGA